MTRYLSLCFLVLAFHTTLFLADTARACIPVGGEEPPCSAYWKANAVFVGVVSETTKVPPEQKEIFQKLLIRFTVERPYRGVDSAEVEVATISGTECDMKVQEGEKWLVYASRDSASGRLWVSSRTKLHASADEDLSYISSLSQGLPEPSVMGGVFDYPYRPWEGIKIHIRGNGLKYEASTDKDGKFTFPAVKPGRYFIRAIFPAQSLPVILGGRMPSRSRETGAAPMVEYQIDMQPGRCEFIQFFGHRLETRSRQH